MKLNPLHILSPVLLLLLFGCDNNVNEDVDDLPGGIEERPNLSGDDSSEDNPPIEESLPELLTEMPDPIGQWEIPCEIHSLTLQDSVVWAISSDMLYGFNAYDGAILVQKELEYKACAIDYCSYDTCLYVIVGSQLHILDGISGEEKRHKELPFGGEKICMSRKGFGVVRYSEGKWNLFEPASGDTLYAKIPYSGYSIRSLSADPDGNIWCVTFQNRLLCIEDPATIHVFDFDQLKMNNCESIIWQQHEGIALLCSNGKQRLFDVREHTTTAFSSCKYASNGLAIAPDPASSAPAQRFWIANAAFDDTYNESFFCLFDQGNLLLKTPSPHFDGLLALTHRPYLLGWQPKKTQLHTVFYLYDAGQYRR